MGFTRWRRNPEIGACDWCKMLAERGAVYSSRDAAGGDDPYHEHCKCDANADLQFEDNDTPTDWPGLAEFAAFRGGQIAANRAAVEATSYTFKRLTRMDVYEEMFPPVTTLAASTILPSNPLVSAGIEAGRHYANRRVGVRRAPRVVRELEDIEEDIERPIRPALRAVDIATGQVITQAQDAVRVARIWEGIVTGRVLDEAVALDRQILAWQARRRARGRYAASPPNDADLPRRPHSAFPAGNPWRADRDYRDDEFEAALKSLWGGLGDNALVEHITHSVRRSTFGRRYELRGRSFGKSYPDVYALVYFEEDYGRRLVKYTPGETTDPLVRAELDRLVVRLAEEWDADDLIYVPFRDFDNAPHRIESAWEWADTSDPYLADHNFSAIFTIVRNNFARLEEAYLREGLDTKPLTTLRDWYTLQMPDIERPALRDQLLQEIPLYRLSRLLDKGIDNDDLRNVELRWRGPYSPREALDPSVRLPRTPRTGVVPMSRPVTKPGHATPWRTRIDDDNWLDDSNPMYADDPDEFDHDSFVSVIENHVNEALSDLDFSIEASTRGGGHTHFASGYEAYEVDFNILDMYGQKVGVMSRQFGVGNPYVYHGMLRIDHAYQGQGAGHRIVEAMDALYEAWGYTTVGVHANIDVGSYTWAVRGGFDWEIDDIFHEYAIDRNGGWINDFLKAGMRDPDHSEEIVGLLKHRLGIDVWDDADIDDIDYDELLNGLSPFDLAMIGKRKAYTVNGRDMWFGKRWHIDHGGRGWWGVRELDRQLTRQPTQAKEKAARLAYKRDEIYDAFTIRMSHRSHDFTMDDIDPDDPSVTVINAYTEDGGLCVITLRNDLTAEFEWTQWPGGGSPESDQTSWGYASEIEDQIAQILQEHDFTAVHRSVQFEGDLDLMLDLADLHTWSIHDGWDRHNAQWVVRTMKGIREEQRVRLGLPDNAELARIENRPEEVLRRVPVSALAGIPRRQLSLSAGGWPAMIGYAPRRRSMLAMPLERRLARADRIEWAIYHAAETEAGRLRMLRSAGRYAYDRIVQRLEVPLADEFQRALNDRLDDATEMARLVGKEVTREALRPLVQRIEELDLVPKNTQMWDEAKGNIQVMRAVVIGTEHEDELLKMLDDAHNHIQADTIYRDALLRVYDLQDEQSRRNIRAEVRRVLSAQRERRAYQKQYNSSRDAYNQAYAQTEKALERRIVFRALKDAGLHEEVREWADRRGVPFPATIEDLKLDGLDTLLETRLGGVDAARDFRVRLMEQKVRTMFDIDEGGDGGGFIPSHLADSLHAQKVRMKSDLDNLSLIRAEETEARSALGLGADPRADQKWAEMLSNQTSKYLADALGSEWGQGLPPPLVLHDLSQVVYNTMSPASVTEQIERILSNMPTQWANSWHFRHSRGIRVEMHNGSDGWNRNYGEAIQIPIPDHKSFRRTTTHEAYHSVEADRLIRMLEAEFIEHRSIHPTRNGWASNLQVFGHDQHGFPIEVIDDDFASPYAGRIYQSAPLGKQDAFEVLTVGLHGLLGGDYWEVFRRTHGEDTEYIEWLLGLLILVRHA